MNSIMQAVSSSKRGLRDGALVAMFAMLASTQSTADALRVEGQVIDGVDISGITYRSGELVVNLAPGSNTLVSMPVEPEFDVPSEDLCGNTAQTVACTADFGVLQDRILSDSIELSPGLTYASEFILSQGVNPNLMVLEFRALSAILPDIQVTVSEEPGGAPVAPDCSFSVSGYAGARIYLAHDGSSADLQSRYCDVDRGARYFLNLSLSNGSGTVSTVGRRIKLAGI